MSLGGFVPGVVGVGVEMIAVAPTVPGSPASAQHTGQSKGSSALSTTRASPSGTVLCCASSVLVHLFVCLIEQVPHSTRLKKSRVHFSTTVLLRAPSLPSPSPPQSSAPHTHTRLTGTCFLLTIRRLPSHNSVSVSNCVCVRSRPCSGVESRRSPLGSCAP